MARKGESRGKGRRLIFFSSPFQGHIAPMLQLAAVLRTKGFSITVIHPLFNTPNPSNYPDFDFEPISDGLTADDFTGSGDFIMTVINTKCEKPFRDCMTRMLNRNSGEEIKISCVIYDIAMHFTQSVADQLNLPSFALRTGGLTSFVAYAAFPALREKGILPPSLEDPQNEELVEDLEPLRVKDLPHINTEDPNAFFGFVASMVDESKISSGLICNSFEQLEEAALSKLRQDLPCPIFPVGPLHLYSPTSPSSGSLKKPDYTCIDWLDAQFPRSVIYVSFGSVVAMEKEQMEEVLWGLLDSEQPFLLVLRRDSVRGSSDHTQVRQLLPASEEHNRSRGVVVEWAPQEEVLAHRAVGGFWTHCGWNSTVESVSEGVPMLCTPSFADQSVNARCIGHALGIGLALDQKELNRAEIAKAVRKLMVPEDGAAEELRKRAEDLKEKARQSVTESGSSCKSLNALVDTILSFNA